MEGSGAWLFRACGCRANMGGTFSRDKNKVQRIGPSRRQSVPSNTGTTTENGLGTPEQRPETCPAVPTPAADGLWAQSTTHNKLRSGGLMYRAPVTTTIGPDELPRLISAGTPIAVQNWLELLGLPQYAPAMEAAGWDDTLSCSLMTEDDLRDVGVEKVGHRRRLLQAIGSLRSHGDPSADIADVRIAPDGDSVLGRDGDSAEPLVSASRAAAFAPGEDNRPSPVPTAWLDARSEVAAPSVDRWKSDLFSRAMLFSSSGNVRLDSAGSAANASRTDNSRDQNVVVGRSSGASTRSLDKRNTTSTSHYQPAAMEYLVRDRQANIAGKGTSSPARVDSDGNDLPPKTVGVTRSTKSTEDIVEPSKTAKPWLRPARLSPTCNPPPNRRHQRTPLGALRGN